MGRWIAVDYGTRRIGIALGDPAESIASPAATLPAAANPQADARQILQWAQQNEAVGIVVGLPLNMDGSSGPQAEVSKALAKELELQGTLPVHLWDERLSSFQADDLLDAAGVRPSRRRRLRDTLAAQVILQSFLDARRAPPPPQLGDPSQSA